MNSNNGFIKLPRCLLSHPTWINAPATYQSAFITLLSLVCIKPQKFDDNGNIIDLLPGQICISLRELASKCAKGVDKNVIERMLRKFSDVQFSRHEVRHSKLIITILLPGIYEQEKISNETPKETEARQKRDIKEEREEREEGKEKKNTKKEKSLDDEKLLHGSHVLLTAKEYNALLGEMDSPEHLALIIESVNNHCFEKNKTYKSYSQAIRTFYRNAKAWKTLPDYNQKPPKNVRKFDPNDGKFGCILPKTVNLEF